jgi:hypothetical protein
MYGLKNCEEKKEECEEEAKEKVRNCPNRSSHRVCLVLATHCLASPRLTALSVGNEALARSGEPVRLSHVGETNLGNVVPQMSLSEGSKHTSLLAFLTQQGAI